LDTDRLKLYRVQRVAGIVAKKRGHSKATLEELRAANTTVNRDFALLRAAMKHASRRTPPKVLRVPYFPMEREDNARQGFIEEQHYNRLRDAFTDPGVQLLYIVAYGIGCRSGELRQVEWSMVDFDDGVIRLPGRITKNGKPRTVPIFAGDMMDYLSAAKAQRDEFFPESRWVFSRAGEPIASYRDQWDSACERAGCSGLLFHDLRRTAVRNMTRIHGIDRATAKKISGHLTDSMFSLYDIIDEDDIKAAKRKVDATRTAPFKDGCIDGNAAVPSQLLERLGTLSPDRLAALMSLLQS
jgi:integrase